MKNNKILVNFHGHVAPGFGKYWLKRTGLAGKNIAKELTDICIEAGLDIYTLTNETFPDKSDKTGQRYEFVLEVAKELKGDYKFHLLGYDAFAIERVKDRGFVVYLSGQSISVAKTSSVTKKDLENQEARYEVATFGATNIPEGRSLDETLDILESEGLPAILEHPYAISFGGIGEENLKRVCSGKWKNIVLELSAQSISNWWKFVPKIKEFTREKNDLIRKIAEEYKRPLIASDDSNWPTHINKARTEIPKEYIDFGNDRRLRESLTNAIFAGKVKPICEDGIGSYEFLRWTVGEIIFGERLLKLKERFEDVAKKAGKLVYL